MGRPPSHGLSRKLVISGNSKKKKEKEESGAGKIITAVPLAGIYLFIYCLFILYSCRFGAIAQGVDRICICPIPQALPCLSQ